jgi:transcriptional regulator with XRE-family HTH domain
MNLGINDTILSLIEQTPDAMLEGIAQRVKARRLELNLTQQALAARSGLKLATYRHFETRSEISLRNLIKIALALDSLAGFDQLFAQPKFETLDQLHKAKEAEVRKRGRRND